MPDISMCTNKFCPSKEYCYRFTAVPTLHRQSFMAFTYAEGEDKCDYFYPNGNDSIKCKLDGVKRDGEICNIDYCTYPKCVQDDYCKYCHKTDCEHKMSCPTKKIQINL